MKVVVYTALIGDIDKLWAPLPGYESVAHVAFVDAPKVEAGLWGGRPPAIQPGSSRAVAKPVWEQRSVTPAWNNRRTARHYKACPHRYMPDADVWVWVDANVRARITPQQIIDRYLTADLVTFRHWDRDCLYDEAAFCAKVHKDATGTLTSQAARYAHAGMPRHWGLAATRVVIRRNTPEIVALNEAWWAEMEAASYRDQVSLPYVCWKAGLRWDVIPGVCKPGKPGDFLYLGHTGRQR